MKYSKLNATIVKEINGKGFPSYKITNLIYLLLLTILYFQIWIEQNSGRNMLGNREKIVCG